MVLISLWDRFQQSRAATKVLCTVGLGGSYSRDIALYSDNDSFLNNRYLYFQNHSQPDWRACIRNNFKFLIISVLSAMIQDLRREVLGLSLRVNGLT